MSRSNEPCADRRPAGLLHDPLHAEIEGRQTSCHPAMPDPQVFRSRQAHVLGAEERYPVPRRPEPLRAPALGVIDQTRHADDRRRQDGLSLGLIVERHVAPDHRDVEGPASQADALHRLLELPQDLRALRRAEVEAIGEAEGPRAAHGEIARGLGDRHGGADSRVEQDESRIAIGGDRHGLSGALDPEHARIRAREHQRIGPDLLVVLPIHPLFRRNAR